MLMIDDSYLLLLTRQFDRLVLLLTRFLVVAVGFLLRTHTHRHVVFVLVFLLSPVLIIAVASTSKSVVNFLFHMKKKLTK